MSELREKYESLVENVVIDYHPWVDEENEVLRNMREAVQDHIAFHKNYIVARALIIHKRAENSRGEEKDWEPEVIE